MGKEILNGVIWGHELDCGMNFTDFSTAGLEIAKKKLIQAFEKKYDPKGPLVPQIVERVLGNNDTRLCKPRDETRPLLAGTIEYFVERGLPIPVTTATGARKYNICDPNKSTHIDVAEFYSLMLLSSLATAVQKIYTPGIDISLIQEDAGGEILNKEFKNNIACIPIFTEQIEKLISIVPAFSGCITPVRETDLLKTVGSNSVEFEQKVEKYIPIFENYLEATDEIEDELKWKDTPEYMKLKEIGRQGIISKDMRKHYYRCASSVYGLENSDSENQRKFSARLLAAVAVRAQMKLTCEVFYTKPIYAEAKEKNRMPLRFSFAQPTPDMPGAEGRAFYSLPTCSDGIPYRAGEGYFVEKKELFLPGIRNRKNPIRYDEKHLTTITPGTGKITSNLGEIYIGASIIQ